ncbi:hypothetical protein Trydic_g786 [Trypoxylus dichotomus]
MNNIKTILVTVGRAGRTLLLEEEDENRVVEFITEYSFSTSTKIKAELQLECAARGVLHKNDIHHRKPAQKVGITAGHTAAQLNSANENINRDWQKVIS